MDCRFTTIAGKAVEGLFLLPSYLLYLTAKKIYLLCFLFRPTVSHYIYTGNQNMEDKVGYPETSPYQRKYCSLEKSTRYIIS